VKSKRVRATDVSSHSEPGSPAAASSEAVAGADGTIAEQQPCEAPLIPYERYLAEYRHQVERERAAAAAQGHEMPSMDRLLTTALSAEQYDARQTTDHECVRMQYWSDGLRVNWFIFKPWRPRVKLPVIVWNRGGHCDLGLVSPHQLITRFAAFLSAGFIVLASQYRGNDGGEGLEEFGGQDVNDVLNLVTLASHLDYADAHNVHLLGESRGGMMVLLALRKNAPVRSAAVWCPMLDLVWEAEQRPATLSQVFKRLIPGHDNPAVHALRERSAIYWPEEINKPLLMMQGTADWRVSASQVVSFAEKLEGLRKKYELVLYEGDCHGMPFNAADRDRRTIVWLQHHCIA